MEVDASPAQQPAEASPPRRAVVVVELDFSEASVEDAQAAFRAIADAVRVADLRPAPVAMHVAIRETADAVLDLFPGSGTHQG